MKSKRTALFLLLGAALLFGAACSSGAGTSSPAAGTADAAASTPAANSDNTGSAGAATGAPASPRLLSVTELVKACEPSIVRIGTEAGVGTGFVIGTDGYIMTNNHVVTGLSGRLAANIRVLMSDGAEYRATVVGTDSRSDLALLKIAATGLKPLPLAKLDDVQVGEDVIAIGYALDLSGGDGASFSVTRGIVSAKNRAIQEASPILGAIQTDAPINSGNSGGPLLNMRGEVVGVNTAVAPGQVSGTASGIGFAVGSDTVSAVYDELREDGVMQRALLGIRGMEALRPAKARELKLPETTRGVYLTPSASSRTPSPVDPNGAAASAGLRPGDVITRIGDYALRTEADLAVAMIRLDPGQSITVEYYRDGEKCTVQVTLGSAASQ